jgi:hypothetical protein
MTILLDQEYSIVPFTVSDNNTYDKEYGYHSLLQIDEEYGTVPSTVSDNNTYDKEYGIRYSSCLLADQLLFPY